MTEILRRQEFGMDLLKFLLVNFYIHFKQAATTNNNVPTCWELTSVTVAIEMGLFVHGVLKYAATDVHLPHQGDNIGTGEHLVGPDGIPRVVDGVKVDPVLAAVARSQG